MNNMFLEGYGLEANPISAKNTDLFASYIFTESNQDPAGLEVILSEADASMSNLEKSGTLMSVVATLNENTQMLNEGMAEVWNKIKEIFKKFLESVKAFFSRIWTKISMSIAKQEDFVKKNMSKIMQGANYADKDGEEDKIDYMSGLKTYLDAWDSNITAFENSEPIITIDVSSGGTKSIKYSDFINLIKDTIDKMEGGKIISCVDNTPYDCTLIKGFYLTIVSSGISTPVNITSLIGINPKKLTLTTADKSAKTATDGKFTVTAHATTPSDVDAFTLNGLKEGKAVIEIPTIIFKDAELGKAIGELRTKITDAIDTAVDTTTEKKISDVIKDATGWFEKTTSKGRADAEKEQKKAIDSMSKALAKAKDDNNGGKMLTVAYKGFGYVQFVNSKHIMLLSKMSNHMWSIVKKAMGNFAYVNKQRNLGENANVSTSNKSTSVLSQFGF